MKILEVQLKAAEGQHGRDWNRRDGPGGEAGGRGGGGGRLGRGGQGGWGWRERRAGVIMWPARGLESCRHTRGPGRLKPLFTFLPLRSFTPGLVCPPLLLAFMACCPQSMECFTSVIIYFVRIEELGQHGTKDKSHRSDLSWEGWPDIGGGGGVRRGVGGGGQVGKAGGGGGGGFGNSFQRVVPE